MFKKNKRIQGATMQVRDLAKVFKLKVGEFVIVSGYTRQGLYQVLERENKRNKPRYNAFISHLEFLNEHMYQKDVAQARIEKNERDKAIEYLKRR